MSGILQRLETDVLLGAGDLPTNAERYGHKLIDNAQWWASNHPVEYKQILKEFVDAGCDFFCAYTENACRARLKKFGVADKTPEVNYNLFKFTREVMPAGSYLFYRLLRPTLLQPPPLGDTTWDEICSSYVEQIKIAEEFNPDMIVIAIDTIEQMEISIKTIREHTKLPIAVLLVLNNTPKGFRTIMGLDPVSAARRVDELNVDIMGTICGAISYGQVTQAVKEMKTVCNKKVYVRPNAGVPEVVGTTVIHPGTLEDMGEEAPIWVKQGVKLIAGCCGTTPEHIAAAAKALRK